jgi:hypothetical protein
MADYFKTIDARKEVERIRAMAGDNEAAHSAEDELHAKVLLAISEGRTKNPRVLAMVALSTSEIEFERWYA